MGASLFDDSDPAIAALTAANAAFAAKYPGDPVGRQPVHTLYLAAQHFAAGATRAIGDQALRALDRYGRDPGDFARAIGAGALDASLASTVHARVKAKLEREPIEDLRIDFEDGFGRRPDDEEDRVAIAAARDLARALAAKTAPPFTGIRIKSLGPDTVARAARTLEHFLGALLEAHGAMPAGFVVTLPKVNVPEQPRALVRWLERLEAQHGLAAGTLRFEIMVETTQGFLDAGGRSPLPSFLDASEGRCTAVHLGVYDFTASCEVAALYQSTAHPMCELARNLMRLACGGRGVFLSDGSTHVLPIGPQRSRDLGEAQRAENTAAVHAAWRLAYAHVRHALEGGFYQGWDLHPAQLPVRFAATYVFFLEGFARAAARLHAFLTPSTDGADRAVADEPATAQALFNTLQRAYACGAIDPSDLAAAGLTPREVAMRSVNEVLASRRATP
ncbi:MAG TPA: phosphoenolpyruvate kinase [Polyangiaceae bacterium]|jgi:citrate lyase beta subunit|nr:phosphoenolpyruvate kinase [Polyangiaceae bacterium]